MGWFIAVQSVQHTTRQGVQRLEQSGFGGRVDTARTDDNLHAPAHQILNDW
jgi:hypothetical protein